MADARGPRSNAGGSATGQTNTNRDHWATPTSSRPKSVGVEVGRALHPVAGRQRAVEPVAPRVVRAAQHAAGPAPVGHGRAPVPARVEEGLELAVGRAGDDHGHVAGVRRHPAAVGHVVDHAHAGPAGAEHRAELLPVVVGVAVPPRVEGGGPGQRVDLGGAVERGGRRGMAGRIAGHCHRAPDYPFLTGQSGSTIALGMAGVTSSDPTDPTGGRGGRIELVGLVKRFGDAVAVDGIDVEIASGEFYSLLGPSGCGKTTTLRMIGGFERPTEGAIRVDGMDVAHVPPEKRPINTVFQSYALFPHMSVWDNVAFGLAVRERRQGVPPDPRGERARARAAHRAREAQAARAVGWPAAAGRARPRPRPRATGAAARRAARRPRRPAPQGAPARALGPPPGGRRHVRLRHPRPGGGAHDERPGGGHEPRADRAVRPPTRHLRATRRPLSWPASSGWRTCCGATTSAVA